MTPDGVALAAIVILVFPIGYFFLASPAFLLVKLDIPPVTQLLGGMFSVHFLMLRVTAVIGVVVFAATGRPAFALGVGLIGRWRSGAAAGSCSGGMPSSAPGMPAMPTRCAGYAAYIGAACCPMPSCLSRSSPAFPTSALCRDDRLLASRPWATQYAGPRPDVATFIRAAMLLRGQR